MSHRPTDAPLVLSDGRVFVEKKILGTDGRKVAQLPFGGSVRVNPLAEDEAGALLFQKNIMSRTPSSVVQRRTPAGEVDGDFRSQLLPREVFAAGHFLENGKILLAERHYRKMVRTYPHGEFHDSRIRRLQPTGHLDPTFSVDIPGTAEAIVNSSLPIGAEIWVGGNFKEMGGKSRAGFARLSNRDITNFEEWMDVVTTDQQINTGPNDDLDGDGSPNFAEYATGTSPLDVGTLPEIRYRGGQWTLAMNPGLGDVVRVVEVSDDLVNWRVAEESEVEIEEENHEFRWHLTGNTPSRYCRVVYQMMGE